MKLSASPFFLSALLLVSFSFLPACAPSNRSIEEKANALLNQRQYHEAATYLEEEIQTHPTVELKTLLGYSYLGEAGVELPKIADSVQFLKKFSSLQIDHTALLKDCAHLPAELAGVLPIECVPVFHLAGFEDPNNPFLLQGIDLFTHLYPDPSQTPQDINLLLAVLYLGRATADYDSLVLSPGEILNDTSLSKHDQEVKLASHSIQSFRETLDQLLLCMRRLFFSYGKIHKLLSQFDGKPLLTIDGYSFVGSEQVTAADFFNFLMARLRQTAEEKAADLGSPDGFLMGMSKGLGLGLNSLEQNLNASPNQSIDESYLAILLSAANTLPQALANKAATHPKFHLHFDDASLPKILVRFKNAVVSTWNQEDAHPIFDEVSRTQLELKRAVVLAQQWQSFWTDAQALKNQNVQESIAALQYGLQGVNQFGISEDTDFSAIQNWYAQYFVALSQFETVLAQNSATTLLTEFKGLEADTKLWVNDNLW